MFCVNCKKKMNDSTAKIEMPGKVNTVEVVNVPCSVCPDCNAQVIDGVTFSVMQKGAKKCKDTALDFNKISGIGIMAGKIS